MKKRVKNGESTVCGMFRGAGYKKEETRATSARMNAGGGYLVQGTDSPL